MRQAFRSAVSTPRSRRPIGRTRRDDLMILCARIGFNPPAPARD